MADGDLPPQDCVQDAHAADARMLQRMAEMILEVGEVARERVLAEPAEHAAVGLTLARLSRSLRLTLALKRRFLDELASFAAKEKAKADAVAEEAARAADFERRCLDEARETKHDAIQIAKTMALENLRDRGVDTESLDQESLFSELNERLDDDSDLEAISYYGLVDLVSLLCAKLNIPFNPATVGHNDNTLAKEWLDDRPEPPPKHPGWDSG